MSIPVGVKILEKASMNAIVSELKPNGAHIGERFFPMVEEVTDKTIFDIVTPGEGMSGFRALDAEAKLMGNKTFKQVAMSVADIAEKARVNVTDVRILREAGELPVVSGSMQESMGRRAELRIAERVARLRERVDNRLEWARINALQGAITVDDGGVKFDIDYGIPGNQRNLTPTTDWDTVATATPINDIQTWMNTVADATGVLPTMMITSRKVMSYLAQQESIRDYFKYTNPVISEGDVRNIIQDRLGLEVIVYEARYTDANNAVQRFLAENRVIMLPDPKTLVGQERFGDTAYVPHPHNNYTGSYYTWSDEMVDPWGIEVGVGITALPRVYQSSVLLTATVF